MGAHIARDNQPTPATGAMVPKLAVGPCRIVAQVDVVHPRLIRCLTVRAHYVCIASVGEFFVSALAAMGTFESH
jgi:hypothetical protein